MKRSSKRRAKRWVLQELTRCMAAETVRENERIIPSDGREGR